MFSSTRSTTEWRRYVNRGRRRNDDSPGIPSSYVALWKGAAAYAWVSAIA